MMASRELHYPKIPGSKECPGGKCIAFEKYDGTNMHFAWERDFGWHAFGTRRDEFNLTPTGISEFSKRHTNLKESADIFLETMEAGLNNVIEINPNYGKVQEIKVFLEFFGPNSFAGLHKENDEKQLKLFDVWTDDFGIIGPEQFVSDFGHLNSARVVFRGVFTGAFTEDVRDGKYKLSEGVVCKGGRGGEDLWMAKVKSNDYMQRLKTAFSNRWEQYWE
jgi:hypothetical protein